MGADAGGRPGAGMVPNPSCCVPRSQDRRCRGRCSGPVRPGAASCCSSTKPPDIWPADVACAGRTRRLDQGDGSLPLVRPAQTSAPVRRSNRSSSPMTASSGVVADGRRLEADAVISAVDPKTTFLKLMDPADLAPDFLSKLRNYRTRGTLAKVNLALSALPSFDGPPEWLTGRIHIGPNIDYLERAFDHAKYGQLSSEPWLDVSLPSVLDPDLAPSGAHVMSIYAHYAPVPSAGDRLGGCDRPAPAATCSPPWSALLPAFERSSWQRTSSRQRISKRSMVFTADTSITGNLRWIKSPPCVHCSGTHGTAVLSEAFSCAAPARTPADS